MCVFSSAGWEGREMSTELLVIWQNYYLFLSLNTYLPSPLCFETQD
jgi:hypothetical protein